MKIQFNTDKTIDGEERLEDYFTTMIADSLERFDSNITRIEVHLSDQNGQKEGQEDIQCVLEARMEGRKPLAVTCKAETTEQAVSGAIDKLIAHLETVLGKMQQ
jgi:ribosome-associated translation inhibitor RaiA